MIVGLREYKKMMDDHQIQIIYDGPIWASGIDGWAEVLLKRLEYEEPATNVSQSVFSVFVEQMNNMLMYSAEKDVQTRADGKQTETSKGIFILGVHNSQYFIQTGNTVTAASADILKTRIDFLNTLDKKGLRQYYRQQINEENKNPESRGAGIGLTEIARRASAPIKYEFEPIDDRLRFFTMYVTIGHGGKA